MIRWLLWPFQFIFALGLESSAHRMMEAHEWREATETYRKLIRWSPRQSTFHTEAGLAHLMLNEWEPAEDRLRHALLIDPYALRAYDLLGMLLANQGRKEEAREIWNRLIESARELAARRPLLLGRYVAARIEEARERLAEMEDESFSGFTIDPGYRDYPGSAPDPPGR